MSQFVKLKEDIPDGLVDKIAKHSKKNLNIFNCGLTNYYENPTTDLLAYFIERSADTSDKEFLKTITRNLLTKAGVSNSSVEPFIDKEEFISVGTQVTTMNRNRIDLLLETTNCVFVFEAKINHEINNPFDDYMAYCKKHFKNKSVYYYLLTKNHNVLPPQGWINITYSELVTFEANKTPITKLDFYIEDFVSHLHLLCGSNDMNNSEIQYVIENSKAISLLFTSYYRINEQIRDNLNNSFKDPENNEFFLEKKGWGGYPVTEAIKQRIELKLFINGEDTRFVIYPRYVDSIMDKGITINYSFWTVNNSILGYFEDKLREKYKNLDSRDSKNFLIIRKDYSGQDFVNEVSKDAISILEDLREIKKSYCG
ncbi:PD-(D/E)XK nuclease superfamily protein [Succinivibrio dextrinosolvens]|uniref:PD-(D/E)XK nuclease family protein n=1 Tax=Succinivibrio dextrinosolvens TaxID=83771 RepID=UPI0008F2871A|nr:PD-(D/E)XK nuclease family protein [Succinivibrio dextrinosolvens]SFS31340.1 PD-(D/E)XK nuclease superfamily protein [Succinivibrio dextrinosolvens]